MFKIVELNGTHQSGAHAPAAGVPQDLFRGSRPRHEGLSDEALPMGMECVASLKWTGRNG
jgi:hypothetical protein